MLTSTAELSAFVGLSVWQAMQQQWWSWIFPVSVLAGVVLGNAWTVMWFGAFGLSCARLIDALAQESESELNAIRSDVFLQRLRHALMRSQTLHQALSDLALPMGTHGVDPGQVLSRLADQWDAPVLRQLAKITRIANRHGGDLVPILDALTRRMERERRNRYAHRTEEAAGRTTIILLSVVPIPLYLSCALWAPEFYRILSTTLEGHLALAFVAVTTVAAHELLRWQVGRAVDGS